MFDSISLDGFTRHLFDREVHAKKAARVFQGVLDAQSPRLSDISHRMPGNPVANYKAIQRFRDQVDLKVALQRLFQEEAPYVLADVTEIERPQATKTPYVGTLKDGKTRGFWLLLLATPCRGRAIPFSFVTYSSRTIGDEATSRNWEHARAFAEIKAYLGERPLVLDREFSYLGLLEDAVAEGINFVIRLKMGSSPVTLTNAEGRRIVPTISKDGKPKIYRRLYYKGEVQVNLIGVWQPGFRKPLWVITTLEPERGLEIYQARGKIEQTFRDLKSLLCLDKLMNKTQAKMEQMVALVLLAYSIGLRIGEAIRDAVYGCPDTKVEGSQASGKHWQRYSGLFILLRQKIQLTEQAMYDLILQVQRRFVVLVWGNVRTHVRT